jgi:hypothetical protein
MQNETCFNYIPCFKGQPSEALKVYIYEIGADSSEFSREFIEFLKALVDNGHLESNPTKACLFLPLVDLLNQNSISNASSIALKLHNSE